MRWVTAGGSALLGLLGTSRVRDVRLYNAPPKPKVPGPSVQRVQPGKPSVAEVQARLARLRREAKEGSS